MRKLTTAMIAGVGIATIGGAGLGLANVSAMNGGVGISHGWNAFVGDERDAKFDAQVAATLAAQYDIDEAEVANIIEQVRDDQFNLLSDERLEQLEQAVNDEKLTQDEHDYIVNKLEDVDRMIDRVDDTTDDERRNLAREIRSELKQLAHWMKQRDISFQLLTGVELGSSHYTRR